MRTACTAAHTYQEDNPIDHVLPWSLVWIDGLANVVLACKHCNGDKSGALPAIAIVDQRARARPKGVGDSGSKIQIADSTGACRCHGTSYVPTGQSEERADLVGVPRDRRARHQLPAVVIPKQLAVGAGNELKDCRPR